MAAQRLKLGRFFGIELFVHWTFGLLVAYVAYSTYFAGGSIWLVGFSISLLLAVFACVTLHEYGHSLAARRYGVETVDITLLPIGGVARLKRIPRVPIQELVIAVAGPAVNVVIATVVGTVLAALIGFQPLLKYTFESMGFVTSDTQTDAPEALNDLSLDSSFLGFAIFIVAINAWLVMFNLIPAFPMDGGRVLRSLLAMIMPYGTATRWAQRIGVVCAVLMAAYAISMDPPRLVMLAIAGFIVYAGRMEARQVEISEQLSQLTVADVMIRRAPAVSMDWNAVQLQQWWQDQTFSSAAVVGFGNIVVGVLSVNEFSKHLESHLNRGHDPTRLTAGQMADHEAPAVELATSLESIMGGVQRYRQLPVVDAQHRLIGWLDFDTLFARASLSRANQFMNESQSAAAMPTDYLFSM